MQVTEDYHDLREDYINSFFDSETMQLMALVARNHANFKTTNFLIIQDDAVTNIQQRLMAHIKKYFSHEFAERVGVTRGCLIKMLLEEFDRRIDEMKPK